MGSVTKRLWLQLSWRPWMDMDTLCKTKAGLKFVGTLSFFGEIILDAQIRWATWWKRLHESWLIPSSGKVNIFHSDSFLSHARSSVFIWTSARGAYIWVYKHWVGTVHCRGASYLSGLLWFHDMLMTCSQFINAQDALFCASYTRLCTQDIWLEPCETAICVSSQVSGKRLHRISV